MQLSLGCTRVMHPFHRHGINDSVISLTVLGVIRIGMEVCYKFHIESVFNLDDRDSYNFQ